MRRLAQLLLFILAGYVLALIADVDADALPGSTAYHLVAYLLLAIGLYGATFGIDLDQAKHDRKIIFTAVTVGVVVKALIIGGTLALAWHNPLFLILGVAVAQIDPLSVAALMSHERMSTRARTVLAAWSSFDDPITVILAFYAASAAVWFGLGRASADAPAHPWSAYGVQLVGNLGLALLAWLIWRLAAKARPSHKTWIQCVLLVAFVAVAVATGWMLAIALIGLFARPAVLESLVPKITNVALYAAAVALGVLLIGGISLPEGLSLGAVAFIAQALVAWPLTRNMPTADRWHLAAAQQHGITAIILGLTLQIQFDGVVEIIAPTIITANVIHLIVNLLIDRKLNARRANDPTSRTQIPAVPTSET